MGVGEAGYYTRENGPSGDDYTGLLAIPAGFLLVGIGLFTLWQSRKGGSVRRYVRRALLTKKPANEQVLGGLETVVRRSTAKPALQGEFTPPGCRLPCSCCGRVPST